MSLMLSRVALVTGGSRGLGAEIVSELARQGHDVAFTYLEDRSAAEQVVSDVEKIGRRALALQADVRDFKRAHEVVSEVQERLGGLHALICNAGVAIGKLLHETSEEEWDTVVDTCLKGAFNYLHAVSPLFMKQRGGKVVCIGSINARRGRPNTASYNAAKAGLDGLVRTVATELGPFNINVNVIAPGFIETQKQYAPGRKEEILSECAIKRLGTPKEIAPVVVFLVSEGARHITGEIITVDAGQSLAQPLGKKL